MIVASQVCGPSRSFASVGAGAMTTPHHLTDARSRSDTTRRYFRDIVPMWQYDRGVSGLPDRGDISWSWSDSTPLKRSRHLDSEFALGSRFMEKSVAIENKTALPHVQQSITDDFHTASRAVQERPPDLVDVQKPTSTLEPVSQWPVSGAKPSVVLANARWLLAERRIRDACYVLRRGATRYPEDEKIAKLLWAISPGRVRKRQGRSPGFRQEVDWLLKHGHQYRGQWLAVKGDRLVASADTLDKLIVEVKGSGNMLSATLIQKIAPE